MIIIFDLDGTILSVNSFRVWSLFMLRAPFAHLTKAQRLQVSFSTFKALLTRKIGLIDHNRLKWQMQRLWTIATAHDQGAGAMRFADELKRFVRPELIGVLDAVASRKVDAILATAAAGDYAYCLGQALGFEHILATSPTRAVDEPDNSGTRKLACTLTCIEECGWKNRPRILFTDHRDDLPLIHACQTVYWFGSQAEQEAMMRAAPDVRFYSGFEEVFGLDGTALDTGELGNHAC